MNLRIISLAAAVLVMPSWSLGCISSACTRAKHNQAAETQSKANFYCSPRVSHAHSTPNRTAAQPCVKPSRLGWAGSPMARTEEKKTNTPAIVAAPKSSLQLAHSRLQSQHPTHKTLRGVHIQPDKAAPTRPCTPSIAQRRNRRYQGSRRHGLYKSTAQDSHP
jgi:hypothetical protein